MLESRLADGIVFKLMLFLELLYELEEEADRVIMTLQSESHVATIVFDHLDVDKRSAQTFNHTEKCTLDEDLLRYLIHRKLSLQELCSSRLLILSFNYRLV